MTFDLLFHAPRAITPAGEAAIIVGVRGGTIVAIEPIGTLAEVAADTVVRLAADEVLLPGLVDTHVHVNDPGRSEWEGFANAPGRPPPAASAVGRAALSGLR